MGSNFFLDAIPNGMERRVVKKGTGELILQAEIVPLTFLVQFTKGGHSACSSSEEGYHNDPV